MNFEHDLKVKNLKVTPQRVAMLKEIHTHGHISIEELYDKIKETSPCTSLATVYKNIATLCESNILREIKVPGHKQRYELNRNQHVHVMCEKCGKLEDLHIDFSILQNDYMQASGYQIHDISAVFLGICPACTVKDTH